MPSPELLHLFTRKLNALNLPYMVSGSVAAIFYGEPRFTNDVDIVLFLKRADLPRLELAFPSEEFYCPPREVMQLEMEREQRGHFNLIHHDSGFKADIYLSGRDQLHDWGIAHARSVEIEGDKIVFAPPEYVILRKLQFYREGRSKKHLRDIDRMLAGLGDTWGRGALLEMIQKHELAREWQEMLAFGE